MRTNSEHNIGKLRAFGRQLCRAVRAGVLRVRRVLTRKRGGVRHRHLAEVSDCAPAALLCVISDKAAPKLGLLLETSDRALSAPAGSASRNTISAPRILRAKLARRARCHPAADPERRGAAIIDACRPHRAPLCLASG